jgi:branched-chain amino acid transport system ATP-binding protein
MTMQKEIGEPSLTADSITLAFGGITALNGISVEIRRSEILAMIGPNGAGKTSMLNVINGFYHPRAGTITQKGRPAGGCAPMTPRRKALPGRFRTSRCSTE